MEYEFFGKLLIPRIARVCKVSVTAYMPCLQVFGWLPLHNGVEMCIFAHAQAAPGLKNPIILKVKVKYNGS